MRDLIIVDCESTGLRNIDIAVEVAWLNMDTGDSGSFIPEHSEWWVLHYAHPQALQVNGYRDRIIGQPQDHGTETLRLHTALTDNAMAGANPRADARWLSKVFGYRGLSLEPFHYRLPDVSSYAAGVMGFNPRQLPGLHAVCQVLGVKPGDSAMGDVIATAECFRRLERLQYWQVRGVCLADAKEMVIGNASVDHGDS